MRAPSSIPSPWTAAPSVALDGALHACEIMSSGDRSEKQARKKYPSTQRKQEPRRSRVLGGAAACSPTRLGRPVSSSAPASTQRSRPCRCSVRRPSVLGEKKRFRPEHRLAASVHTAISTGHIHRKAEITSTTFASVPDDPFSTFELNAAPGQVLRPRGQRRPLPEQTRDADSVRGAKRSHPQPGHPHRRRRLFQYSLAYLPLDIEADVEGLGLCAWCW